MSQCPAAIRDALRELAHHPHVGLEALGKAMGVDSRSGVSRRLSGEYAMSMAELFLVVDHFQDRRWRPDIHQLAKNVGHAIAQECGAFAMAFDPPDADTNVREMSAEQHALLLHRQSLELLEGVMRRKTSSGDLTVGDLPAFIAGCEQIAARLAVVANMSRAELAQYQAQRTAAN